MPEPRIIYIDPQSYHNLSVYDYHVLTALALPVLYLCSSCYDYKPVQGVVQKPVFNYNRIGNPLLKALSYAASLVRVALCIMRTRPRVVHVQWMKMPAVELPLYCWLRHRCGFRLVYTAHNVLPHNASASVAGTYARIYRRADALIVHAEYSKQQIIQMAGVDADKIYVARHGLIPQVHQPITAAQKAEWDTRYRLQGKLVFASLGEQSHYKGTDLLQRAWLNSPTLRHGNCVLVVAGKQKQINLEPLANCDNVVMVNRRLSNEEFYYFLSHTDVYVLPYREISQSGALLTAMAAHVGCVVSNVGALTEPLQAATVVWPQPAGDAAALQHALEHLATHPEEVRAMQADTAAWHRIDQFYSWQNMAELTRKAYREV